MEEGEEGGGDGVGAMIGARPLLVLFSLAVAAPRCVAAQSQRVEWL